MSSDENICPEAYLPEEFIYEGLTMTEKQTPKATLERIKDGEGPDYEALVATYPRTGNMTTFEITGYIYGE